MASSLERGLYANYLSNNARKREPLPFELTLEEFSALIKQNCYICERPPEQVYWKKRGHDVLYYNGVDRLDNRLGYALENCRACCKKCNSVKSDMELSDLKEHLVRMLRGLGGI